MILLISIARGNHASGHREIRIKRQQDSRYLVDDHEACHVLHVNMP
jgi:hypothetical protein